MKRSGYKSCDGDPPERLVLKRGRKQACRVGPCSWRICAMAGRCGQRNRVEVKCAGTSDKGVVLSFPLSESPILPGNLSVSFLRCCLHCFIVVGQGHRQRSHLVCQGFWQPTVLHPFPIWCPSASNICPEPNTFFISTHILTVPSSFPCPNVPEELQKNTGS